MSSVVFPDGTRVWARGLNGPPPDPPPQLGLYLDERWRPTWPAIFVDWPDWETPSDSEAAATRIRQAFDAARGGCRVEVACGGGLGRTGTVLSCMAVLAGVPASEAVAWVRANFDREAVETDEQAGWVDWFAGWVERADAGDRERSSVGDVALSSFVDYLCLVYHEARNVRHLIRSSLVEAGRYERLRALPTNRDEAWVSMGALRREAKAHGSAAGAVSVFLRRFGLSPDELLELYRSPHWKSAVIGGNRWAAIADAVVRLGDALDGGQTATALDLLRRIPQMCHNTGQVGEKLRRLLAREGDGGSARSIS